MEGRDGINVLGTGDAVCKLFSLGAHLMEGWMGGWKNEYVGGWWMD